MTEKTSSIPSRIKNATVGGFVTGAEDIDAGNRKSQKEVNQEVQESLGQGGSVDSRIAAAVNVEKTRAEGAESALDGRVDTLEDAVGTGGSVDSRISAAVNAAKSEIKGNATSACDTLGEAETLISAEATRAQAAETALDSGKADKATTLAGYGITDAYTKGETYSKTEINDHIHTPNQGYVTAIADSNTTTANLKSLIDTAAGSDKEKADFIYRVGCWDGSQYNDTMYSEYAWIDTDYVFLSKNSQIGEVFDISAYHANTPYVDLTAALGTNGQNIPQSLRKGGMSVKFIQGSAQSSDNKYAQHRLVAQNFTTDVTKWQGVDDEPTDNSDNLVKSGGVYRDILPINKSVQYIKTLPYNIENNKWILLNGNTVDNNSFDLYTISVEEGKEYLIRVFSTSSYYGVYCINWANAERVIGGELYISGSKYEFDNIKVTAPIGAIYAKINVLKQKAHEFWFRELDGYYYNVVGIKGVLPSCDVNTLQSSGKWTLGGNNTYTNTPTGTNYGFIEVTVYTSWLIQEFYTVSGDKYFRRFTVNGTAPSWTKVNGIVLDSVPTINSVNGITSGGVYESSQNQARLLFKGIYLLENYIINNPGGGAAHYIQYSTAWDLLIAVIPQGAKTISVGGIVPKNINYFDSFTDFSGSHWIDADVSDLTTIPNAKVAIINCKKSENSGGLYSAYIDWTYVDSINNLSDHVNKLDTKLYDIQLMLPDSVVDNSFFNTNGSISSHSTYAIYKYRITPGNIYMFSGAHGTTANIPFIAWADTNDDFIRVEEMQYADITYVDKEIVAPSNAEYAWLNFNKNDGMLVYNFKSVVKNLLSPMLVRGYLPSCSLGDIRTNGIWNFITNNTYQDKPDQEIGSKLEVSVFNNWIIQEYTSNKIFKRIFNINTTTIPTWTEIGGGTITNEYTFNEYSQTVNLTAAPSITTDSNNYLASTGDSTDRTSDILAMLSATGVCHLGPGWFVVSNLIMPDNTSLIGSGSATIVYLEDQVTDGFAIKMSNYCMVKDMTIQGANQLIGTYETNGTRNGIVWQGNYTQTTDTSVQPLASLISNVIIKHFNGSAIYLYDTGVGTANHVYMENAYIYNCNTGANILYYSEFHRFTNVHFHYCYYGAINNGGNNWFVNCDFSSCMMGIFMDNSQEQSPNNTHGGCVGCEFAHINSNQGYAVKILNASNGFLFTSCQLGYSGIYLENSKGILFNGGLINTGNPGIYISGGTIVMFSDIMFLATPSVEIINNNKVKFVNCYNITSGESVNPINES